MSLNVGSDGGIEQTPLVPQDKPAEVALSMDLRTGGEMGLRVKEYDWSSTSIGLPHEWPPILASTVTLMMSTSIAIALFWGPDRLIIYNDAYSQILGPKHPEALGKSAPAVWGVRVWKEIGGDIDLSFEGLSVYKTKKQFFFERPTYTKEMYYSYNLSPVLLMDGTVGGSLIIATEEASRVLHERREAAVRKLGAQAGSSGTLREACTSAVACFEEEQADIAFSLMYLVTPSDKAVLVGTSGQGMKNHPLAFPIIDLNGASPWPIGEVARNLAPVELVIGDMNLPGGVWPEPSREAIVIPVSGPRKECLGVLVLGLSPRRKMDEPFRNYFTLIGRQLSSNLQTAQSTEEERHKTSELAKLDAAKTAFFSSCSHELRTPLTLILGPLEEILLDTTLSEAVRSELLVVKRNALRLLKLTTNLLDFSRVEAGRMRGIFRPMDLGAVIKDFCGVFRSAINRAGLKFLVDVESSTEKVYIDADMWEKIVYNLLSNALKCTLRGSISVHYHHVDGFAEVTIADTGVGIPPEDVEKVFERFHRVEQVYKRSSEGTGIGLALTLELVRLHSGTISLSSKLSEGSSFTVRVPLGRDHLQNSQVLETASDVQSQNSVRLDSQFLEEIKGWDASAKEDTSSTNDLLRSPDGTSAAETPERPSLVTEIQKSGIAHWGGGMGKAAPFPYVLVVDDNRDMASYTKSLLAPFWPVKVARDGQEAWETCQRRAPGLIVSDVMMPRVSGLELVYKIRCSKKLRLVPIILLSARAGEEARVEGLESGADDYLAKPFGARELVARARVHLELGRLRSELMHLGQVSPVAIFRTNQTGDTMYRSEKLVELTGESPSAPAFATVYPDDLEATRNVWYESVRTGTPCKHEFRCLRPQDGKIVHVLAQWEPEFDEDGSVLGYLGAITDITERVTLQTAQLKEAEENRKSQEIFIDMISHEIRNPIAGIAGSCDLLRASLRERKLIESVAVPKAAEDFGVWWEGVRSRLQTATDEESLDAIESCAQHQKMITDDVLNLSKLKSGTYSVVKSWFDPIRLVRNSVNMFRAQMEKKDISFQMKMDWEGRGFACGDPERLTQVIVNLLSNSIKFTANCPHRFIEVGLKAVPRDPELDAGDKVDMEITVTDTGIGMTPEAQAKLFERFSQATIRTHREYGGTGLGLHISKQMIQMMGGTIGMVSELGKGTTFTFRVPTCSADDPSQPDSVSPERPVSTTSLSPSSKAKPPLKSMPGLPQSGDADGRRRSDRVGMVVLIVEDNRINQRVLKRQLERSAYSTITADNGSEAVQIVQAAKPGSIHAILMDIEMPVMGGLAATMAIREFEVRLRCCPPTSISQDTDTTPINISTASIPSDPLAPIATIPPFSPSSLVDSPLNNAQSIPIIGVSGNARHEHRDSALRAGMDAYLVKPHSLEVLLSMIDHWVRKRKSGSP